MFLVRQQKKLPCMQKDEALVRINLDTKMRKSPKTCQKFAQLQKKNNKLIYKLTKQLQKVP